MQRVYQESKTFYNLVILFALIGAFVLVTNSKGEIELWVNQFHNPALNLFFYYITYLGDGLFSVAVVILLFFRKIYYGILSLISFASTGLITQALKRSVFHDFPRPSKFFENGIELNLVEGLKLHSWYSFPSGHSSGAFAVFLTLSLISVKNTFLQILLFTLAMLTALSRVYLLQHFFMDIYAGTLLGVVITSFVYFVIQYKTTFPVKERLQEPAIRRIRKSA